MEKSEPVKTDQDGVEKLAIEGSLSKFKCTDLAYNLFFFLNKNTEEDTTIAFPPV